MSSDFPISLAGNADLREFMELVTSTTHVKRYIKLPMICVMGDTSSGKSSLLSALSMVQFPSSHELTTRCPILLQMTHSNEARATVSIQWNEKNNAVQFEPVDVCDMTLLPGAIIDAQNLILQQTKKEVAFDVICVSVYGPQCLDLTLLDLPGLARARASHESESLVEDIDMLLQSYLQNPRCIILAVLPANVDFHNSQILGLAQTVDPEFKRTIPVLTKPDLIDAGAEDQVLQLLLGKKMDLGFHMCKGRGQAALDQGQSLEESLQDEADFFLAEEPWRSVTDRSLFGTVQLRQKLGEVQMALIRETIPDILKEVHSKQQYAFSTLVAMGNLHQTSADKRRYYQDYTQSFVSSLKATLSGKGKKSKQPSAAAKLHDVCNVFMQSIREGSLGTIKAIVEGAQVLVTSAKGDVQGEVVHVDHEYACVDYVNEADKQSDVLFEYVGYVAKEPLEENDVWSDGTKVFIARQGNTFDLLKLIPLNRIQTDPSWLLSKIADNRTDDLPCFLNVDIFKSIVSDFIEEDWRPHCTMLINQTSDIVMAAVSESLQKPNEIERFPKLHALIKQKSSRGARALLIEAEKQVNDHLAMEKHPYTQDDVLLANIAAARHRGLKRELEVALRLDQEDVNFDTAAIQTIMEGVFERNRRKSVELHMAEDMEIVLESYGKIATKRVIDRSPMICWEVFRSLVPTIQDTLWNITDAELEQAMADTEEFTEKHKALTEELEEMNKALNIFQSLLL
ncbi:Dynamin [Fragilaria crotonensis]|nr:Dynamin [Fragilaria crotonensis]